MSRSTLEKQIRSVIIAQAATVSLIGRVVNRRFFEDSPQDLRDIAQINGSTGGLEVKFLLVEAARPPEDADTGYTDAPDILLEYDLHLFHQQIDERPDGSNSTDDFTAVMADLSDLFRPRNVDALNSLNTEQIKRAQIAGLRSVHDAKHGQLDKICMFTGHQVDFRLTVIASPAPRLDG